MIVQKAREMSHACRSVFTISSAFISSFFGRKMSSDLQDIVRRVVENLSNIQRQTQLQRLAAKDAKTLPTRPKCRN